MCKLFKYFMLLAAFAGAGCATSQQAEESEKESGSANAAATQQNATNNQVASAQESGDDELICRNEIVTGSNFRRRVCRTRAQIREESQQTQEVLDIRRTGTTSE